VKQDVIEDGNIGISTVFLGLDHRHFGDGPPLLFETMVFGGSRDGTMYHSPSARMVKLMIVNGLVAQIFFHETKSSVAYKRGHYVVGALVSMS
jgi:hypothetical protein